MVPLADFSPLAEQTGLIVPLGAWILLQACTEAMTWTKPLGVALKLTGVQLKQRGLVAIVKQALADSGLPGSRLEVEIAESALLNDETLEILQTLRKLGIRIATDDSGPQRYRLSQPMSSTAVHTMLASFIGVSACNTADACSSDHEDQGGDVRAADKDGAVLATAPIGSLQ